MDIRFKRLLLLIVALVALTSSALADLEAGKNEDASLSVPAELLESDSLADTEAPFLASSDPGVSLISLSSGASSEYSVGTLMNQYVIAIVGSRGYGEHYVLWRAGQYDYYCAVGNISYSGDRYVGTDCDLYYLRTFGGYNSGYEWSYQKQDITVSRNGMLVWSDLGGMPMLDTKEGGNWYEQALLYAVAVAVLWYLFTDLRRAFGLGFGYDQR